MFIKIKKVLGTLKKPKLLRILLSMNSNGYLKESGWINSFDKQMPIDTNNNPLPWVTYPFIDFISNRLKSEMEVFEFGSGNSTLWYAKKVKFITSVEHDKNWYDILKKEIPLNVNLYFKELIYGGEYSKISTMPTEYFDIISIDGRDRVNCMKDSIKALKSDGIIVLDDSERVQYTEGIQFLLDNEFKRIDFWGISPGLFYKKNTTIFYKTNNCLGI